MKFTIFALLAALTPSLASAGELVYKLNLDDSKMDATTAFEICGVPKEIRLDAKEDIAAVAIKNTITPPFAAKPQYIQATSGNIGGGSEPFTGDYRVRVALVSQDFQYPTPIVSRVEVITYGNKAAPKAFTVEYQILNYRESAEIGESSVCTGFAYRLQ